jgi:anti-sigma factor (TIGR02949 family)
MGCDDVRRVIYFFLDDSLGEKRKTDVGKHLNVCPECGQRARISKRIRDFFRGRLRPMSAPERFKTRLTRSIRAIRVEF